MAPDEEKGVLGGQEIGESPGLTLGSARETTTKETISSHHDEQTESVPAAAPEEQHQEVKTQGAPTDFTAISEQIPRSQRRGLFGRFTIIPEVVDPRAYSNGTKWLMTVIAAIAGATSSTGSSIFYPALGEMAIDLHSTPTVTNLSLAFYLLAMAITPLWWSHFSETLGRRTIYIISFSLFTVFSCISAVSVDVAMLIVMRVLSGGAAASVQAVGAGTVSDLWEPRERGRAIGVFYLGPLCGPGLAPIIGGALTQAFGWRSTLWFLTIFGGVLFLMIFFCLPETLARRSSSVDGGGGSSSVGNVVLEKPRRAKVGKSLGRFVEPLRVLAYLRHPPITISVATAAIGFASLYVVNISIQYDFASPPYNFTTTEVGVVYLAPTLGYAVASVLGGKWTDYIMAREARKAGRYDGDGKLQYLPEDRIRENVWLAATLYPAAMIWYGWCIDKGVHWIVPCIANLVFGIGSMLMFGTLTTMLTEFMPGKASGGVALNNLARCSLACVGAIVTQPLIEVMGTGWMCTMVGLFAWVTGNAAVLALRAWGPRWRVDMDRKLNTQKS
ncbi:major facilitator superfamily domain-containing protein [Xylariales sp. PMI_506]|nr:major facilitator superfamily domain-containing protein [Xylariales sp. PMI_506]